MDIIVTIKHVPDPNIPPTHFSIDETGTRVVSPVGIPPLMNGYDANALEQALVLREEHGGKVTAISLGDESSRESLRRAIAMGADAGILIMDSALAEADSGLIARVLASAIKKIGSFDLVLSGRQASDSDSGQTHLHLAEALGLPSVSPIRQIEEISENTLIARRLGEDVTQRVRVTLPALLGISSEINEPRYPAMRGIMAANRAQIPTWTLADLDVDDVSNSVVLRRLYMEEQQANVEFVEGETGAEIGVKLADRLREVGVI